MSTCAEAPAGALSLSRKHKIKGSIPDLHSDGCGMEKRSCAVHCVHVQEPQMVKISSKPPPLPWCFLDVKPLN